MWQELFHIIHQTEVIHHHLKIICLVTKFEEFYDDNYHSILAVEERPCNDHLNSVIEYMAIKYEIAQVLVTRPGGKIPSQEALNDLTTVRRC